MFLCKDVICLMVKQAPEVANGLMRSCKTMHRWINEDQLLMIWLTDYYQKQLYGDLNNQIKRFFLLPVGNNKDIASVYLTEGYRGKKECRIQFVGESLGPGFINFTNSTVKSLNEIKTERTNPQSQDALKQITQLHRRYKSLRKFESCDPELTQRVDDIVSGLNWVLKERPKPQWDWGRFLTCLIALEVIWGFTMFVAKRRKGFWASVILMIGVGVFLSQYLVKT